MNCPHCNKPITIHIGKPHPQLGPGWDYGHPSTFETTTPYTGSTNDFSGPIEATRTQPARPASVESDVVVPLFQSLVSGFVIAFCTGGLSYLFSWPWYSFSLTGSLTIALYWFGLLGDHRKSLWSKETVSSLFKGDSEPQPKAQPVSLEVAHRESGRIGRMQFIDLPPTVTQDQLIDWSIAIANNIKSPARSNWAGNGKPFSRDSYDLFVKAMVQAGVLRDIPGKGKQLTVGGRHALKSLVNGQ